MVNQIVLVELLRTLQKVWKFCTIASLGYTIL